jgi:GNAT superfamily N-acetyltransferase
MSAWSVHLAPVPDSLDAPEAWGVHGAADVSSASDRALYGHDDLAYSARYLLTKLREQAYATRVLLVAVPAGASPDRESVAGFARLILPLHDNEHLAYAQVTVRPDRRRRGAGRALLEAAERVVAEHGRTTVVLDSEHGTEPADGTPDVLTPPNGSGRIRATDPGAVMAAACGYTLEQAERYSRLDLPVDPDLLERLHGDALAHAGTDYRLLHWTDRVPDAWVDQFAVLETRMSTDVPLAGLEIEEDRWDADRVRVYEGDIAAAGHGYLCVAAEHVPSGTLAAFTMVEWPVDQPEVVFQEDTLVLREHRGRRLGMLVKADLLRRLGTVRPGARRVHTWNAEENGFMLGINVALGFRPRGVSGQWQKHLAVPSA